MRYNIEVTLDCRSHEDAKKVADSLFFGGFIPIVDDKMVRVIAKNVGHVTLEFLADEIESNDLVISSSFHQTQF